MRVETKDATQDLLVRRNREQIKTTNDQVNQTTISATRNEWHKKEHIFQTTERLTSILLKETFAREMSTIWNQVDFWHVQ